MSRITEVQQQKIQQSYLPSLKLSKSRNSQGPHAVPHGVMKSTEFQSLEGKNQFHQSDNGSNILNLTGANSAILGGISQQPFHTPSPYQNQKQNNYSMEETNATSSQFSLESQNSPALGNGAAAKLNNTNILNYRSSLVQNKNIPLKISNKLTTSKNSGQILQKHILQKGLDPSIATNKNKMFFSNQVNSKNNRNIQIDNNYGLPNFQPSKISHKSFGTVKAFAANTNVGLIRQYNEDRIAIILNVIHPTNKQPPVPNWPNIQIFGIYDGHGGSKCAEYLKDNLHNNIIYLPEFPTNIQEAISKGAVNCDNEFINMLHDEYKKRFAETKQKLASINRAGSCALMIICVDEDIYVMNVGDSRAVMSRNDGADVQSITKDHKPMEPGEYSRITQNGGKIYQSQTVFKGNNPTPMIQQVTIDQLVESTEKTEDNPYVGPYRVAPGRLSVSRTFGDLEAKIPEFGGMPGVVICNPDVHYFKNGGLELDFVIIGSDGIFDKVNSKEIGDLVWGVIREHQGNPNMSMHQICGKCADEILKEAAKQKTMDNISVVMVGFKKLQDYLDRVRHSINEIHSQVNSLNISEVKQQWNENNKNQSQKVSSIFKSISNQDSKLDSGIGPDIYRAKNNNNVLDSAQLKNSPYQNQSSNFSLTQINSINGVLQGIEPHEVSGLSSGKVHKLKSRNINLNNTHSLNNPARGNISGGVHLPPMSSNNNNIDQHSSNFSESLDKRLQLGLGKTNTMTASNNSQMLKKQIGDKRNSTDGTSTGASGYSMLLAHYKDNNLGSKNFKTNH